MKKPIRLVFALFALALLSLPAATAFAEEGLQVDQFEIAPDQRTNFLNAYGSDVIDDNTDFNYSLGVFYHYIHKPLSYVDLRTDETLDFLVGQHKVEPWLGVGAMGIFDVGVVVPIAFNSVADDAALLGKVPADSALGDIRVVPKVRILDRRDYAGFGLAFAVPMMMPTGDQEGYVGAGSFRFEPRLIADYRFDFGLQLVANLAYQIRPERTVLHYVDDDVFRWNVAASMDIYEDQLSVLATLYGDAKFTENKNPAGFDDSDSNFPMELAAAVRYATPWGLQAQLGGGLSLLSGIGSSEFRLLASVGFQPQDYDADGDGLLNSVDKCPNESEDPDAFEDEDGCPELDNDQDGILDGDDQCPLEKEDIDNFEDENGCPDPDNDGDGILDIDDQCPDQAEDVDGFEDTDGCPEFDNDKDGVCDQWVSQSGLSSEECVGTDKCPNEPEDKDGFKDEDGCPDPDNDLDGICDPWVSQTGYVTKICSASDKCPDQAEIINGVDDDDGCPDEGKVAVVVAEDTIELHEQIFFDTGKASIQTASFPLLDQVATVMKRTPRILKVRIEGHTDDVGKDEENMKLSKERAAAVEKYLVTAGVEASRLSSEGYGETMPVVDTKGLKKKKELADARAQNRRVVIKILELAP
jgi:outer membrane protein OmpA-like peptidoglycan-associated protein